MSTGLQLTVEDFANSNWQSIADKVEALTCEDFSDAFMKAAHQAQKAHQEKDREVFLLFGHLSTLVLDPNGATGPFRPLYTFGASRSSLISDFPEQHLSVLAEILSEIADPELRARVGDVIWERLRDFRAAESAVRGYLDSATRLLAAEGNKRYYAIPRIERAVRLAASLGRNQPTYRQTIDFISNLVSDDKNLTRDAVFNRLYGLLLEYREGDPEMYAERTGRIARQLLEEQNWGQARFFFEMQADWARLAGNEETSKQARINAADTYVSHAEMLEALDSDAAYVQAQFQIQQAIIAYRAIGHSQARVNDLIRLLRHYQRKSLGNMQHFSFEVNTEGFASAAQDHVSSHDFIGALLRLAFILPLPVVSQLREFVVSQMQEHPFPYIIATRHITEDGRVVAERPSVDTDEERAILYEMYRQAVIECAFRAAAIIRPATYQIGLEHWIHPHSLLPYLSNNPVVPAGRELLLAKGLSAGFKREFDVAIHLLIPQLENCLRHILFQYGVETSGYNEHGIQEVMLLGDILFHDKLTEILGDDTVFILRCLLQERLGGNLRNRLSHGLMEHGEMYADLTVYTWWLTLRLCMLPFATDLTGSAEPGERAEKTTVEETSD